MTRLPVVLLCLLGLSAAPAEQTLRVVPLQRDGQLLVSFQLGNVFTDELKAALHSGLTVSFVYKIDLRRSGSVWLDRTIASAAVTASVKYDNLTRRYTVTRYTDARMEWAKGTDSEEVVRAWLTTDFERLPLFSNTRLEPNGEYYVRVRAHTTPRNATFLWPWDGHDVSALAKFTFIR